MKISTKGRYGLTLMISLAKKEGQGCISLKSIAEENNLSDLYLEQLVGPLRNAGLIRSVRGAKGGYQLRVPAEEISAGDIIRLLDESKFEQAKGNVKETVGNVTDNKELEKEGQQDKATGKAKEVVENAKNKITDAIDKLKK